MYLVSILPENYLEALSTSKDNFGMGPKGKQNKTKTRVKLRHMQVAVAPSAVRAKAK